ncbi:hypothetical protein GJ496_001907 [Pomphorhynchus laevis]|nr:hypothetical protein GJ496_006843 [Pomphorhynchus laevis]KAI0990397.1 hypothetical protein GJ496_001907 [Pomphorhynchus laevis]
MVEDKTAKEKLIELHPSGGLINDKAVLKAPLTNIVEHHPVRFSGITPLDVVKAARITRGAAGPSGMDAFMWLRRLEAFTASRPITLD